MTPEEAQAERARIDERLRAERAATNAPDASDAERECWEAKKDRLLKKRDERLANQVKLTEAQRVIARHMPYG